MWVLDMYKYAIVFLAYFSFLAISHGLWNMDTENNPNRKEKLWTRILSVLGCSFKFVLVGGSSKV